MRKAFVGVVSLAILVVVIQTWAQAPQGQYNDPSQFHLATPGQLIAGIPHDEALEIYQRQAEKLRQLPGAVSVSFTAEGLVVATVNPEVLPTSVEGLPVFAVLPSDPDAVGALQKGLPPRPSSPLQPETPQPVSEPPTLEVECSSHTYYDTKAGRCRLKDPPPDPPSVELLPPPPGVIVLRPSKIREQAITCPPDSIETKGENDWRFCVDPKNPEPIPPLWAPPIAGIPYEEALEIHNRHVEELSNLPGVDSVGLGVEGIHVYTSNPSILPSKVEGLPIIPLPPLGPGKFLSHIIYNQIRPLHGAAGLRDNSLSGFVTLTGVALADGKPWLIFPSHGIAGCMQSSPCPPSSPPGSLLSGCLHTNTPGQATMIQPVSPGSPIVGYAQRWTTLSPTTPQRDVAAAFLENDTIEGNGSLNADRKVEVSSVEPRSVAFLGTLPSSYPTPGTNVTMRTSTVGSSGTSHEFSIQITEVNQIKNNVFGACLPQGVSTRLKDQTFFRMLGGFIFIGGDSGSPVFNANGNIIGMINGNAGYPNEHLGYGTNVNAIKEEIAFDAWYGTDTVNDNSIGTFYTPTAGWTIDNGNGKWDGPNCLNVTDTTKTDDYCFTYGMPNSDRPVTGDWNNDGSVTVGVYRTTTNPQQFLLRDANSAGAPNYTISTGPPSFGYKPVAGKWNGVNQTAKVGIFNPGTVPGSQRGFYLDNGDKLINGCPGPDHCFYTGSITLAEDIPIAGDWDNNGSVTIGVFRPSTSTFYLSNADPAALPDNSQLPGWNLVVPAGSPSFGYLPAVGDWTGPSSHPKAKLGVFRPGNGTWYLDNGNRSFPGCAEDQCPSAFGGPNQLPVSFGQTKIKAN